MNILRYIAIFFFDLIDKFFSPKKNLKRIEKK